MFFLLPFAASVASAAPSITALQCESKSNPLGIDILRPRLSWQLQSSRRGEAQSAYRILVATAEPLLQSTPDLWDSGKITSGQSLNIEYDGKALALAQTCYWKVIIWNLDGAEITSDPATFETGLLAPSDWQAKWIDNPDAQHVVGYVAPGVKSATTSSRPPIPFTAPPYFRKTYAITKPIARARLYASALGLYRCSINGRPVPGAVLTPDWTDYRKRVQYQAYDVATLLQQGPNAIGVLLADGWYSGHVGLTRGHVYGQRPAFLAQLVISYTDGSQDIIPTDASWKTAASPLLSSDLLNGEDYDAQTETPNWDTASFDDTNWKTATVRDDRPTLQAQIAPPVREIEQLPVKSITEPAPGHFTYDFDQNLVGYVRLKITAPAGTKLTLKFAEMLNPDRTIYTANLRGARATDTYMCRGGGEETWQPHFTFHGFRYAEITGAPEKIDPANLTAIVISSDCPQTGAWQCSDPLLNQLQSNIVWGQRGNYLSVPTDCPQRDERLGWMGDAQVFIRTATFNNDVRAFFDHWLLDVAEAQGANGAYSDVSPKVTTGEGVAAWADAGIICPWTLYQTSADTRILARQYDSMARYIDYLKANSKNLIRPAKGYGDWLSIQANTPKDLLATAYFAYSAHLMASIAAVLNKNDDATKYNQLFEDIRKAFNEKFVSADGRLTGNTQTAYLLALKFNLLDEPNQKRAVQYLVDDIHAKNDHLSTGFVGVSYLLPILTQYGHTDLAYRLLNQDTFPSWLFSVKQGATTIWERWDGWTPEKGFQTPTMNSFNHYSLGSCGQWMYETITGICPDPANPGYKHILIHPIPGGNLTSAKATCKSPYGLITADWQLKNNQFTLAVTIPPNTTATVQIPTANPQSLKESTRSIDAIKEIKTLPAQPGCATVEIPSGSYTFTADQN